MSASRTRSRSTAPATVDTLDLEGIRALRAQLQTEETRVSYWRRILQARIDVVRAGEGTRAPMVELGKVLADAGNSRRRVALMGGLPADDTPPLPDLAALWSRVLAPDEAPDVVAEHLTALEHAELEISVYRGHLHRMLDELTDELIARYRAEPSRALEALPRRPGASGDAG